jgi:transposase
MGNDAYNSGYWSKPKELPLGLPERQHAASAEKKRAVVQQVRKLILAGYSISAAAKELGISSPTAKKYAAEDFDPAFPQYGSSRESKLKPYTSQIDEMLRKGHKFREIEDAIRQNGYNGAASAIRMYASRERKLIKAAAGEDMAHTELIERKWLLKLLYKPLDKL